MLHIAFSLWTLRGTGFSGWVAVYAWLVYYDVKLGFDSGNYLIRLRFCGIGVEIAKIAGKNVPLVLLPGQKARQMAENSTDSEGNTDQNYQYFVEKMLEWGAATQFTNVDLFDKVGKSFVMPEDIDDALVERLVPGAKVVFGKPEDFVLVEVEGSRRNEDGTTIYYGRQLAAE